MDDVKTIKQIFSDNLKYYLGRKGINQTIMSRDLNIPETTVSNWIKAETYPRPDKIQIMADYFNINRSDLTEQKPINVGSLSPRTVEIPILGKIACGEPILAMENVEGYIFKSPDNLPGGNLFALKANGTSMEPTIPDGAVVIVREQPDVENGEIAAVLVNGDREATLKRIRKQESTVWLVPDNPKFDMKLLSEEYPARIIGKAISFEMTL